MGLGKKQTCSLSGHFLVQELGEIISFRRKFKSTQQILKLYQVQSSQDVSVGHPHYSRSSHWLVCLRNARLSPYVAVPCKPIYSAPPPLPRLPGAVVPLVGLLGAVRVRARSQALPGEGASGPGL